MFYIDLHECMNKDDKVREITPTLGVLLKQNACEVVILHSIKQEKLKPFVFSILFFSVSNF